jgi:hypothetical protein
MNQWKEGKEEMETETHSVFLLSWPVDPELPFEEVLLPVE